MAPSETRSFFKVVLSSTLQEGKLKFPKKFAKEQAELPESVRLCLPTGRCWSVRIERVTDNDIWLHDGLLKFMEDNYIGIEYLLVFRYDGNSEFGVLIFDLTAAEIQYSCVGDSINRDNRDQTLIAEIQEGENGFGKSTIGGAESDDSDVECLSSSRLCVSQGTNIVGQSYFTRRRKQVIEGGIEVKRSLRNLREDNAADEDNVKTNHYEKNSTMYKDKTRNDGIGASPGDVGKEKILEPGNNSSPNFFEVTLTSSYIEKRILRVPSEFSQLHISNSTRFIKLIDAENNEWVVRYIHRGYNNVLSSGWGRFVQEKKLVVGDVCIFELARGDDGVKLRVTISRSAAEIQYSCIDDSINHDNTDQILIAETVEGKNGSGKSAIDGM
ncbi:hypothetical protein Leryth_011571 [Lithospermum erythrorhizon]|nr:hypothetical protein Leryth_011571 [Lithospermum erythrorhizon]